MSNPASTAPDAVSLLTHDHEAFRQLFRAFEALTANREPVVLEKAALAEQICMHLSVHAQVEQEIFYPAVRAAIDDDALMDEAQIEHAAASDLIADIASMNPRDALFDAKVAVLGEHVGHHANEEQRAMFAKARRAGLDMAELGARIAARKQTLINEYGAPSAGLNCEDESADPVGSGA